MVTYTVTHSCAYNSPTQPALAHAAAPVMGAHISMVSKRVRVAGGHLMARDRLLSADNGHYRPLVAAADAPATWIANRARTVGIECSNKKVYLKRWSSSASPVPLANHLETHTEGADMRWVCCSLFLRAKTQHLLL